MLKKSTVPAYQPEGGSVFLFSSGFRGKNADDWKTDGYTWKYIGKKEKTISSLTISKVYYHIKNGKEKAKSFSRSAFQINGQYNKGLTVFFYEGDKLEYKGVSHGSAKNKTSARP